jgi:hypothetical protein
MHPAEELAHKLHNEAHAYDPQNSHVIQVWEDGEITMQKCGELLWQRRLIPLEYAPKHYVAGLKFPVEYNGHSYAFVASQEEAKQVRALLEIQ